jgi:DNA helicase-2/ATP-dependent DNA helicase PcrA
MEEIFKLLGIEISDNIEKYTIAEDFIKAVRLLNQKQLQAVRKTDGPVMVIAGPGTGKTQILSSRIGKILLESDIQPQNILCLTYTEAGAHAIKKRLTKFLGAKANEIAVYTFHALCSRILADYYDNDYEEMEVISDLDRRILVRKLFKEIEFNTPLKPKAGYALKTYISDVERFIGDFKKENYEIDAFLTQIERAIEIEKLDPKYYYKRKSGDFVVGDLKQKDWDLFAHRLEKTKQAVGIVKRYQEELNKKNLIDLNDLILKVIEVFKTDESFLYKYQERFQYIMIDEFQDSNGSQLEIAEWLCHDIENPNIMIVGDDDQSIYRFQGANIENIQYFYKKYISHFSKPEIKERIIVLDENYRSSPVILQTAAFLIQNNKQRIINIVKDITLNKDLKASNPDYNQVNDLVQLYQLPNRTQEYQFWALEIEKWSKSGVKYSDIAVLFQKNSTALEFTKYLDTLKLPYQFTKSFNILEDPFVHTLIQILNYVIKEAASPNSAQDILAQSLFYDFFELKMIDISKLMTDYKAFREEKEAHIPLRDFLVTQKLETHIQYWFETLENLILSSVKMPPLRFFDHLIDVLNLRTYALKNQNALSIFETWNTLNIFFKDYLKQNNKATLQEIVQQINTYIEEELEIKLIRQFKNSNAIQIMTLHGSKGLEFDKVILFGNNEERKNANNIMIPKTVLYKNIEDIESIQQQMEADKDTEFEEQRRLFYVALTRAHRSLYLSYSEYKNDASGKDKAYKHLPFIDELPAECIQRQSIEIEEKQALRFLSVTTESIENQSKKWYLNTFLEQKIKNMKWSVSMLNTYIACPLRFYFTRLLNVPEKDNKAMTIGNVFHYALETFFKHVQDHNEEFSEKLLLDGALLNLEKFKYLLTPEEFDDYSAYIRKIVPIYYKNEVEHWNTNYEIEQYYEETWNDTILNGKIDKLEWITANTANIKDFKTGSYENAKTKFTSPETEDLDQTELSKKERFGGDYWRQATFYKLLFDLKHPNKELNQVCFDFIFPEKGENIKKVITISNEDVNALKHQILWMKEKVQQNIFDGCQEPNCVWCNLTKNIL